MTLKEVIVTGKPFRRPSWGFEEVDWYTHIIDSKNTYGNSDSITAIADSGDPDDQVHLDVEDVLADDYIIKTTEVSDNIDKDISI